MCEFSGLQVDPLLLLPRSSGQQPEQPSQSAFHILEPFIIASLAPSSGSVHQEELKRKRLWGSWGRRTLTCTCVHIPEHTGIKVYMCGTDMA